MDVDILAVSKLKNKKEKNIKKVAKKLSKEIYNLVKNKKRHINENHITYTVPSYVIGNDFYDRDKMLKRVFELVRDKYPIVRRKKAFRIYIEWEKKIKKNQILKDSFKCISKIIVESAEKQRDVCVFTLPAAVGHKRISDMDKTILAITTELNKKGFRTETNGNRITIYLSEEDSFEKPLQTYNKNDTYAQPSTLIINNIKDLNNYTSVIPINTRSTGNEDVMATFKYTMKDYKPKKAIKSIANTITPDDEDKISKQLRELEMLK